MSNQTPASGTKDEITEQAENKSWTRYLVGQSPNLLAAAREYEAATDDFFVRERAFSQSLQCDGLLSYPGSAPYAVVFKADESIKDESQFPAKEGMRPSREKPIHGQANRGVYDRYMVYVADRRTKAGKAIAQQMKSLGNVPSFSAFMRKKLNIERLVTFGNKGCQPVCHMEGDVFVLQLPTNVNYEDQGRPDPEWGFVEIPQSAFVAITEEGEDPHQFLTGKSKLAMKP